MNRALPIPPEAADIALADLSHRLSAKMIDLAALSVSVQQSVTESLIDPRGRQTMNDLQRLDRMTQLLQDLATLLSHVAEDVPADQMLRSASILRGIHRGDCRDLVLDPPPSEDLPVAGTVIWL